MKFLWLMPLMVLSLFSGEIKLQEHNASDLVYAMPLNKYPQWLCEATLEDGTKKQFISVKSMMQVYQNQDYFIKHSLLPAKISKIYVQDYLSGKKVEAQKAFYIFGSHLVGPHGDDLIPFASERSAKLFELKYGGTKILPFARLSKGLIRYLDM